MAPIKLITLSDLVLRADGSWSLKTRLPNDDSLDTWLRPRDAAKLLRISSRDVYRYLGKFLVYRRPTPHRIEISLRSLKDFQAATNDPDFWESKARQAALHARVQQTLRTLIASSLQVS